MTGGSDDVGIFSRSAAAAELRPCCHGRKPKEKQREEERFAAGVVGFQIRESFGINGCRVLDLSFGSHGVFNSICYLFRQQSYKLFRKLQTNRKKTVGTR